jgi:hypothetical protein
MPQTCQLSVALILNCIEFNSYSTIRRISRMKAPSTLPPDGSEVSQCKRYALCRAISGFLS